MNALRVVAVALIIAGGPGLFRGHWDAGCGAAQASVGFIELMIQGQAALTPWTALVVAAVGILLLLVPRHR